MIPPGLLFAIFLSCNYSSLHPPCIKCFEIDTFCNSGVAQRTDVSDEDGNAKAVNMTPF